MLSHFGGIMSDVTVHPALHFLQVLFSDLRTNELIHVMGLNFTDDRDKPTTLHKFFPSVEETFKFVEKYKSTWDLYVSPAPRNGQDKTKKSVTRMCWLWADIDASNPHADEYQCLPATMIVNSGKGKHVYWRLSAEVTPADAEALNKRLEIIGADTGSYEYGHKLRIPGLTDNPDLLNRKYDDDGLPVTLESESAAVYALEDIAAFLSVIEHPKVGPRVVRALTDPVKPTNKSFSHLDWEIFGYLVDEKFTGSKDNCTDEFLIYLFYHTALGTTPKRKKRDNEGYLIELTLPGIRAKVQAAARIQNQAFTTRGGKLYFQGTLVASFTLTPESLLKTDVADEDVLMCTVTTEHRVYTGRPFPRSVFTDIGEINKSHVLPDMSCMWLDTNNTVLRMYAQHLWQQVITENIPERLATPILGRHGNVWVTPHVVFDANGPCKPGEEPIVFLPSHLETPGVTYDFESDASEVILAVSKKLWLLNEEEVMGPVAGWFGATPYKPQLFDAGIMFPILNMYGTFQTGKTSLLEGFFMRLMGYQHPHLWTRNAMDVTRFATTNEFSASNTVPRLIDEFKIEDLGREGVKMLMSILRGSYTQMGSSRGNADQTVNKYVLRAPVIVSGEDPITDLATVDRCIVLSARKASIAEKGKENKPTAAYTAYKEIVELPLHLFAPHYVRWCLDRQPDHKAARHIVNMAFPGSLGDRFRNSIIACTVGLMNLAQFFSDHAADTFQVNPDFIRTCFSRVVGGSVNTKAGFSKAKIDEMIVDLLTDVAMNRREFLFEYDPKNYILWFKADSAYNRWLELCRIRGKNVPITFEAIASQIRERTMPSDVLASPGQYLLDSKPIRVNGVVMRCHGLSLPFAAKALDIPDQLDVVTSLKNYIRDAT